MRVLDLFCGAGGAAMGLHRAWPNAEIVGVDIEPQPRYPFKFVQYDAVNFLLDRCWFCDGTGNFYRHDEDDDYLPCDECGGMLQTKDYRYDFIWASPPCQRYSPGAGKWGTQDNHPHLIPIIRKRLTASGIPFVIENIAAARKHLMHPIMLCGTQFDLGVFRHRLFEASFLIGGLPHAKHSGSIGDGKYHTVTGHAGGSSKRDGWKNGGTADWKIAMGIDWMIGDELAEAIPPAYSEYIAKQFEANTPLGFLRTHCAEWSADGRHHKNEGPI